MNRTQFLEAASKLAIGLADQLGLTDDVVTPPPPPPPPPSNIHGFDFEGGTAYPSEPKFEIYGGEVEPGATEAHILCKLSKPAIHTVIGYVHCKNGVGGKTQSKTYPVRFNPGDPLEQTVRIPLSNMKEGNSVWFGHGASPDSGNQGFNGERIRAVAGATPQQPIVWTGRAPIPFVPHGKLVYSATGKQMLEDGNWLDRLAHGRTQVGNAETGYYMKREDGAFALDGDDLILRSWRLPEPIQTGTPRVSYPFGASMLTGLLPANENQNPRINPAVCFKYGTIEWEVKMPNRKGSWPALWLLSSRGGWPKWPFEIDVFEGFYYNNDFRAGSQLSTNLHGGAEGSNKRTFTRPSFRHTMSDYGLENTLDTAFHKFACVVDPDWITMFVDEKETFRYANPFTSTDSWYPLTNVAVKAKPDDPYDTSNGDMVVRSIKIWRA